MRIICVAKISYYKVDSISQWREIALFKNLLFSDQVGYRAQAKTELYPYSRVRANSSCWRCDQSIGNPLQSLQSVVETSTSVIQSLKRYLSLKSVTSRVRNALTLPLYLKKLRRLNRRPRDSICTD